MFTWWAGGWRCSDSSWAASAWSETGGPGCCGCDSSPSHSWPGKEKYLVEEEGYSLRGFIWRINIRNCLFYAQKLSRQLNKRKKPSHRNNKCESEKWLSALLIFHSKCGGHSGEIRKEKIIFQRFLQRITFKHNIVWKSSDFSLYFSFHRTKSPYIRDEGIVYFCLIPWQSWTSCSQTCWEAHPPPRLGVRSRLGTETCEGKKIRFGSPESFICELNWQLVEIS